MNKVFIDGRLTKDPDLKTYGADNKSYCTFTVAVNRDLSKDQRETIKSNPDNHGIQTADFIFCTAFGYNADFISEWFSKGKPILIEGKLSSWSKEDDNGNMTYGTNVVVDKANFCLKDNTEDSTSNKNYNTKSNKNTATKSNKTNAKPKATSSVEDDDLPF